MTELRAPAPSAPRRPRRAKALGRAAAACMGRARLFLARTDGVVAIEVGLLALPFCMMLTGVLVIGFMAWCNSTLDYATQKAARQIMTGALQAANTTSSQFRTSVLCGYLPRAAFDCTKLVVNLQVVTETASPTGWYNYLNTSQTAIKQPPLDNSKTSFCMGTGNTYQVLEVLYPLPVLAKFLLPSSNANATAFVIMSTAAFKNEPFQGASNQGSC